MSQGVLGYGSHGTVVFKGKFDGCEIAVKRIFADFYDISNHEVEPLRQSNFYPHVVKYFCRESTDKFAHIVFEFCACSLSDVVEASEKPKTE